MFTKITAIMGTVLTLLVIAAPAGAVETPVLSATGETLNWTDAAKTHKYVVQAIDAGEPNVDTEVTGTTLTPPADPDGGEVTYQVRNKANKIWSNQVTITYSTGFTCTTTLSAGANVGSAIESAASGATICLNSGTYAQIKVTAAKPAAAVTVRAAAGASPNVEGAWIHGTHGSAARENLIFRSLNMTGPVLIEENAKNIHVEYSTFGIATTGSTTAGSNKVTGIPSTAGMVVGEAVYAANISNKEDTTGGTNTAQVKAILSPTEIELGPSSESGEKEGTTYVARATSTATGEGIFVGPEKGVYQSNTISEMQKEVYVENDTFTALGPCPRPSLSGGIEKTQNCSVNGRGTCYKSIAESQETTFSHNVCGPYSPTHYTQPPCNKLTMNNNLFMGPSPYPVGSNSGGEHQNAVQCAGQSNNVELSNNLAWKTQDIITYIWEGIGNTIYNSTGVTMHNNLVVGGHTADAFQIGPINGFTFTNNTTVGGYNEVTREHGFNENTNGTHAKGENYTLEHNIFVKRGSVDSWGLETSIGYWANCEGASCVIANNAAEDGSAEGQPGGLKCPSPEWEATSWNPLKEREEGKTPKAPTGYYVPKAGSCLAPAQGYQGGGGP